MRGKRTTRSAPRRQMALSVPHGSIKTNGRSARCGICVARSRWTSVSSTSTSSSCIRTGTTTSLSTSRHGSQGITKTIGLRRSGRRHSPLRSHLTMLPVRVRIPAASVAGMRRMPSGVGENRSVGSLLVVTGPPGAGKSSVARVLADAAYESVLIEGDAFFGFLASGAIEPWLPASNDQNTVVTKAAASAAGAFATGGYTAVYDGVVGPWFLPTFGAATGLDRLDYAILLPS